VGYGGSDDRTFGAFAIPTAGFRQGQWDVTPRGAALMVNTADVLIALFPRAVEGD